MDVPLPDSRGFRKYDVSRISDPAKSSALFTSLLPGRSENGANFREDWKDMADKASIALGFTTPPFHHNRSHAYVCFPKNSNVFTNSRLLPVDCVLMALPQSFHR